MTANAKLQAWVQDTAAMCRPEQVVWCDGSPAEYQAIAKQKIGKRFDWLAGELERKDYLMGKQFTVADGYLFVMLQWTKFVGIDLAAWPVLVQYQARVAARPKVRQALLAEGLIKETASQTAA